MGMTIDEKDIEVLSDILVGFEQGYHIAPSKERIAVLHKTLDIMRKYQKIQEVLEKVWNVSSCMLDEAECLNKIMETYRTVR